MLHSCMAFFTGQTKKGKRHFLKNLQMNSEITFPNLSAKYFSLNTSYQNKAEQNLKLLCCKY